MKSLVIVILGTAAVFASAAALSAALKLAAPISDVIAAGAITTAAAAAGILPTLFSKRKDAVGAFLLAFVGTVLHLVTAAALTAIAVAAHWAALRLGFVCWLLGGYWVSLILLIWQLRHWLLSYLDLGKAQGPKVAASI